MKLPSGTKTDYGYLVLHKGVEYELHRTEAGKWQIKVDGEKVKSPFSQKKQAIEDIAENPLEGEEEGVPTSSGIMQYEHIHPCALLIKFLHGRGITPDAETLNTLDCYAYAGPDGKEMDLEAMYEEIERYESTPKFNNIKECYAPSV